MNSGTRYKGKQISVPQPETLAKNTLDATHKSRLKFFKDEKRTLNPKKAEVIDLEKQLQKLKLVNPVDRDYPRIIQVEDRISALKKDIEYIESGKAELEYYSKAGELLIEFYDNVSMNKKEKAKGKVKKAAAGKSVYDLFMQPNISESVQSHIAEQRLIQGAGEHSSANSNYEQSNYEQSHINDEKEEEGEGKEKGKREGKGEGKEEGKGERKEEEKEGKKIEEDKGREKEKEKEAAIQEIKNQKGSAVSVITNVSSSGSAPGLASGLASGSTVGSADSKTRSNKGLYHKLTNFVEKTEGFKRADFFDEYLNIIDPHYVPEEEINQKEINDSFCEDCNCYRNLNPADATMVCPQCSTFVIIVIDSDKPNYKDPPAEISNFPYRRINHFNECLSQFQAKESTEIPQMVYDIILTEMKKERLTNMAQLTREKVHTYLKKQANKKFTNYYEHIPHIIHRLTGIQPKTMTPKMEEELRRDFHKIQEPYTMHKPKNRKNFLNYNYVLHKLCQIRALHDRDYKEFLTCFPLLKSRDKLLQQDIVWKKICVDLDWKFIKSV